MSKPAKTLEDLARITGLSVATISRALSNHPAVNAVTKRKIARLAIELSDEHRPGFQPMEAILICADDFGLLSNPYKIRESAQLYFPDRSQSC